MILNRAQSATAVFNGTFPTGPAMVKLKKDLFFPRFGHPGEKRVLGLSHQAKHYQQGETP